MQRMIRILLWAALVLALAGTIANTTWAFSTVNGGGPLGYALGGLQAFAADLGLVALAATLAARRANGERARWLWAGVGVFVAVSIYASYLHSYAQAVSIDAPLAEARPILLGVFLPLMLFCLVEVISHARKPTAHTAGVSAVEGVEPVADAHNARTSDAPSAAPPAHDADEPAGEPSLAPALAEFVTVAAPAVVATNGNGNGHAHSATQTATDANAQAFKCDGCERTFATLNMTVQQPDPLAVGGWRVVTLRAGGGYAVTDYPSEDDARRAWVLARITDDYAQLCAPSAACAPSGAVGASHGWTYQPAERKP